VKEIDWQPQFNIRPQHSQSEFWPITNIEPEYANRQAIGLDVAFESNRYEGIERARLTGKAQITSPITRVQDSKKTPGVLLYVPFYKRGGG
jgi:CHASE1-domain containing sensor protein